jgi:dissimilatory sulfite reductase (desulfoviridin) alpha/beta subunit
VKTIRVGCKVTIGGRWGKDIRIGTPLDGIYSEGETLDLIEKTILLFKEQGLPGERLSTMVERLGRQETEQALMGPALLERRQKILNQKAAAGDAHVTC